jgi:drug/metabolite transporter (DMT)-like permease
MEEKRAIDGFGAIALTLFSAVLAFNMVVVKVSNSGLDPVFQAGLRSVLATPVLVLWIWSRRVRVRFPPGALVWGVVAGFLFAVEFLMIYLALDLTTVARASVLFYSMPVWLALAAHFLLPGDRLTRRKIAGLALAMTGVALALANRGGGQGSLAGDLMALAGTLAWAGIALVLRATPLSRVEPAGQLLIQLVVSAPILLILAPLFGPPLRDPQMIHWLGLAYQTIAVASLGILSWFWLLTIYRASSVAAFSFLAPVFAVILGWAVLGEHIAASVWLALVLVVAGLVLVSRK